MVEKKVEVKHKNQITTELETMANDILATAREFTDDEREQAASFVEKAFDNLLKEYPDHEMTVMTLKMTILGKLGTSEAEEKVIPTANWILERDPWNFDALLRKARALSVLGRVDEAVILFEQMTQRKWPPREAKLIYMHYVKLLRTHERFYEAENVCRRALALFPKDVTVKTTLAIIYKAMDRNKEALKLLNELPQNDPYVRMEKAHAYINMLDAKSAEAEIRAAKDLFKMIKFKKDRLRNRRERASIINRLEALSVALEAVKGNTADARRWFHENYNKFPAAKLVGPILNKVESYLGARPLS